jgi:hypothetical protein
MKMMKMNAGKAEQIGVNFALLAVILWFLWQSWDMRWAARVFPQSIGVLGATVAVIEVVRTALRGQREDLEPAVLPGAVAEALPYLVWFVAYYGAIYLFGFLAATSVFVFAFTAIHAGVRWYVSFALAFGLIGLILAFGLVLDLRWPTGRLW